jgi:hypothetical protein
MTTIRSKVSVLTLLVDAHKQLPVDSKSKLD